MPGPLEGIRVLEFTQIIAGPLAGRLLADLGADVIKIEPPSGEPWRFNLPFLPTESRGFIEYNRGKRSLPLDLTRPEAQRIMGRLIPQTDVTLMNFRPDVAAKLNVDYETLSELNPRLVYCELTGYGRQGPEAHLPGYDMILQAMSGLMAAEGKVVDDVPQQISSSPVIDTTSGFCLAWSVCAALYSRERTGRGQKIETSLLASGLALMGARFLQVEPLDGENRERMLQQMAEKRADSAPYPELLALSQGSQRMAHHGNIYYRVYQAKDGPIGVGCLNDRQRKRLLDILDLTDIRFDPGYDPNASASVAFGRALEEKAVGIFQDQTIQEWLDILEERGIPAGPVRFAEQLFDDPQIAANGLLIEVEHRDAGKVKMIGPIAQFSGTPVEAVTPSPALGEHSGEILRDLGFSEDEIKGWKRDGTTV